MILETDAITPTEPAYMQTIAYESLATLNEVLNVLPLPKVAFIWWNYRSPLFTDIRATSFASDSEHRTAILVDRHYDHVDEEEKLTISVCWVGTDLESHVTAVDISNGASLKETLPKVQAAVHSIVHMIFDSNAPRGKK